MIPLDNDRRHPMALSAIVGRRRAASPERYEAMSNPGGGEIEWLTPEGVAERLRDLVQGHGTGRLAGDHGQCSLAGAQPKTALLYDGDRWGIPSGPIPTTHILKPPAQRDLDGFDINEHLCLRLASGAFLDALAFNWVIGGTDAHGKNYSLLLSPVSVRLAPFYDLISVLPYPKRVHNRGAKLAMRVDREYRLWRVRRRHWEGLAVGPRC